MWVSSALWGLLTLIAQTQIYAGYLQLEGTASEIQFIDDDGVVGATVTADVVNMITDLVARVTTLEGAIGANNPVSDPMDLTALTSGWYYIDVSGFELKEVYIDNDRNGGGWVLAATVRMASCQRHWNVNEVGLADGKGPDKDSASTQKFSDAWMNGLRSQSSYSGSTGIWMEATTHRLDNFISSAATINSVDSVETQDARTQIATSYEGGLSNRDPNTGTRGLGDHHTGAAYFAYQRHPESGSNCGFKSDSRDSSDGYLWIK